jgi:hypothetical protein
MRYYKIGHSVRGACAAVMFAAFMAFADTSANPRNPQTNASDRNFDTPQPDSIPGGLQKAEDGANRGLNKVDQGVHKLVGKSRRGARRAKKKAGATAQRLGEPAKKPAY